MSNFNDLARYSEKYCAKFLKISEPLFSISNINYFFHQSITDSEEYVGVGTQPDFVHYYFDEKLHECNPFIMQSESIKSGVYLFDTVKKDDFKNSMRLIEEKFNLKQSILIVEREGDRCNQYGFGVPSDQCDIKLLIMNEFPLFKRFIEYFNQNSGSILRKMQSDPVPLPKIQKKKSYVFSGMMPEVELDRLSKLKFLSKMKAHNKILGVTKLSKREIECAKLFLNGFTAKEIGQNLEISFRTVECYLGNIKHKLTCHSKAELIALLSSMRELGLF